jgi:hypothetical protein
MNWFTIIAIIFQYGPELINALKSLIDAILKHNTVQGQDAIGTVADLAGQIVRSLQARSDLNNEQKREQAWQDLIVAADNFGIKLSETNARTLAQLAYQDASGK